VLESIPLGFPFKTRYTANAIAKTLMSRLGCAYDDLTCLRALPFEQIVAQQGQVVTVTSYSNLIRDAIVYTPVVDPEGDITNQPLYLYQQGKIPQNIPILEGFTKDDGLSFVYGPIYAPLPSYAYTALIYSFAPRYAAGILTLYPPSSADSRSVLSSAITDMIFICPLLNATSSYLTRAGKGLKYTEVMMQ